MIAMAGLAVAEPMGNGSSFVEDFSQLSKQRWYISDGWSNGNHQNCTWSADQVKIVHGALHLSFVKKPSGDRQYACAEIQTKQRFGYGVYEARMKTARGSGFNTAFFTYIGPADKQPWHEIDFEVLGKNTAQVQLNQYIDGKGGNEELVAVPGDADSDFHDYAFVWEKGRLRYYVDNELVQTVTDPEKLPTQAMKVFFSLWASDNMPSWLGAFRDPDGNVDAFIDRASYTAPGDSCQYPDSLVCKLK
ncbi:glycoside hydrolase family 16 protein [Mesorhizobium sp. AaZ16]|uniref:endo-1,3-1,4-beta-glycanase ExoK n=1 Tax=Mesorhizobium sp. AaZ16 TaxID=3402289 RepID=UPI00374EB625